MLRWRSPAIGASRSVEGRAREKGQLREHLQKTQDGKKQSKIEARV